MVEPNGPTSEFLQLAFPGPLPVTGCDFLAYSCAAARELHPLPCLRHKAKTRKPKDISKNGKLSQRNVLAASTVSQMAREFDFKSPRPFFARASAVQQKSSSCWGR